MTKTLFRSYPFLISAIWWLLVIIVNPIGDFPLNDDWSYATNTKALTKKNEIFFHSWGAMTLFAHTIWGTIFCKIFGFSFTVLRMSTLILGWIGLLTTYFFFREGKFDQKIAFWTTLLIGLTPFFFTLSYSYMTEVPFYCFLMLGAYFFLKNINGKSSVNILLATFFSIIAVLIRQHGVLMPIAFFIIHILKNKPSLKVGFQAVTPVVLTFGSMISFINWREKNYGLSDTFRSSGDFLQMVEDGKMLYALKYNVDGIFRFWGLFLLPLLIILIPYFWKKIPRIQQVGTVAFTLLLSYPYFDKWYHGFHGNVFYNLGMGPRAGLQYPLSHHPILSEEIWSSISLVGFIGGILLLLWLSFKAYLIFFSIFQKKSKPVNWALVFNFAAAFGYFLFLLSSEWMFSRYYLIPLPFLIFILLPKEDIFSISKPWKIIAGLVFIIISIFSIGATKDYLSWNRERWKAASLLLEEENIPLTSLNGGFEMNGWWNIPSQRKEPFESYGWWVENHEGYKLSFGQECGYETYKTYPIPRVLPPGRDSIFVLKRLPSDSLHLIFCDMEKRTEDNTHFLTSHSKILLKNGETQNTEKIRSGNSSVKVNSKNEYTLTVNLKNIEPCDRIWVDVWRYPADLGGSFVFSGKDFYLGESQFIFEKDEEGWGRLAKSFTIPPNYQDSTIQFYLYNPQAESVWFDDLSIKILKVKKD